MKKLILPFVLGAMMVSCSRDNDDVVVENIKDENTNVISSEKPVLLTKMIDENGVTEFKYDDDKLSEIVRGDKVIKYLYEGDFIVEEVEIEGESYEKTIKYEYREGRLSKVRSLEFNINSRVYTLISETLREYEYSENDRVFVTENIKTYPYKNIVYYGDYNHTGELLLLNNSIVKSVKNEGWGNVVKDYIYDDKNNPLKNVRGNSPIYIEKVFSDSNSLLAVSDNNILSTKTQNIDEYEDIITYEYEYNAEGYPIKVIKSSKDYLQKPDIITVVFEYNK